jgi:hypothetical protein
VCDKKISITNTAQFMFGIFSRHYTEHLQYTRGRVISIGQIFIYLYKNMLNDPIGKCTIVQLEVVFDAIFFSDKLFIFV